MTEVYLAEGNAYAATKHVLEMSNFSSMIKEKSKIVIKPNLAVSRRPNEGITTDVKVVRAILDKIPKKKKVVVLEGSTQATTSFKLNGYEDLKKDYNVDIVDANLSKFSVAKIKNPFALKEIQISEKALESDFLISVGKLKIHSVAKVTASIKNMMGVCPKPQKLKIHSFIPESLVDLISARKPDFAILDAVVVNEIDEIHPHPVKLGLVLASKDCVALDYVGSKLIGVAPEKVPYIELAAGRNMGRIDDIEIVGGKVGDYSKKLKGSYFNPRSFSQVVITRSLMSFGLFEWYCKNILPSVLKAKKKFRENYSKSFSASSMSCG